MVKKVIYNTLSGLYDLIILDVMLPSMNGFEILKKLSQEQVTIIVATHDKNLAQIANKIYEVKDGKIN